MTPAAGRALALWGAISFSCAVALVSFLTSCATVKQDQAEALHLGQLGSCVDKYTTRSEIDACRADVERAWGRYPGLDGGGHD